MGLSTSPDKSTQRNEAEGTSKNEKKKRFKVKTNKKSNKNGPEYKQKNINPLIGDNLISTYHPMPPYRPYWQPCIPPIPCKWVPYVHFNMHTFQVPVIINPNQYLTPIPCTYPGIMPPLIAPLVTNASGHKISTRYEPLVNQSDVVEDTEYVIDEINEEKSFEPTAVEDDQNKNSNGKETENETDALESYLKLPKNLFPKARSVKLNPNPIIDEFCKLPNVLEHAPWILDLEFGVSRSPITRTIPFYNVKLNSVHCKNTPDAIHPGFESCSQSFKDTFLFYYDSVISTWYTGYVIWNDDNSIENFQSWLMLPVQLLGMCWS